MLPVHLKQLFELPFQLLRDLGWSPHLAEMNDDLVLRTYVTLAFGDVPPHHLELALATHLRTITQFASVRHYLAWPSDTTPMRHAT